MSRVLGLDPGSLRLGYGLIEASGSRLSHRAHGVLVAPRNRELPERLSILFDQLEELLDRERPDAVALEKVFAARNVHSALTLGQARGVILLALARRGLALAEYAPAEVKLSVAGHGRAEKSQLAAMVARLLRVRLEDAGLDATDALAIAICHAQELSRERLLRRAKGEH